MPSYPARAWSLPVLSGATFTFTESLEVRMPDDSSLADVRALGEYVQSQRAGYGFSRTVRTDTGTMVTPWWVSARDCAVHVPSGRALATGYPTHLTLGLPAAYDGWLPEKWGVPPDECFENQMHRLILPEDQLYGGFSDQQRFEMLEFSHDVFGIDLNADATAAVTLEWWGGYGAVGWANPITGERRILGTLDRVAGNESPRISPDGRWALVPTNPGPLLVNLVTADFHRLPHATSSADWWPQAGSSCVLLTTPAGGGTYHLARLDLSTGAVDDLGPISYRGSVLPDESNYVANVRVDPTGNLGLCATIGNLSAEWLAETGACPKLSLLDLNARTVEPILEPFFEGDTRVERDCSNWRWLGDSPTGPVTVSEELLASTRIGGSERADSENWDRVAQQAWHIVIVMLNNLLPVEPADFDAHLVRPELLRAYAAACRYERNDEVVDWVMKVTMQKFLKTFGPGYDGWVKYALAEQCIREGRPGAIDWAADAVVAEG